MLKDVPSDRLLVTESGILKPADVKTMRDAGVHAFLVGGPSCGPTTQAGARQVVRLKVLRTGLNVTPSRVRGKQDAVRHGAVLTALSHPHGRSSKFRLAFLRPGRRATHCHPHPAR